MTQRLIPRRLGFVVVSAQGSVVLVCNIEAPAVRAHGLLEDVREYFEFAKTPTGALAELLEEQGLSASRLAYEEWHLMAAPYEDLRQILPMATLVPANDELEALRAVKTEWEIEQLQEAARRTEAVAVEAFRGARAGESERKLADRLFLGLREVGAEDVPFVVCSAGVRSTIPHAPISDDPLVAGQVIKIDFGGSFGGYYSDIARMGVVGAPSAEQRERYGRVLQIHREVIDGVRPGITAADVFALARDAYEKAGIPFTIPHYGHGLGLDLHELPILSPADHTVLTPGMVLCLEPRATLAPNERYHIEDLVLVTETGCRVLSDAHPTDEMLTVEL